MLVDLGLKYPEDITCCKKVKKCNIAGLNLLSFFDASDLSSDGLAAGSKASTAPVIVKNAKKNKKEIKPEYSFSNQCAMLAKELSFVAAACANTCFDSISL